MAEYLHVHANGLSVVGFHAPHPRKLIFTCGRKHVVHLPCALCPSAAPNEVGRSLSLRGCVSCDLMIIHLPAPSFCRVPAGFPGGSGGGRMSATGMLAEAEASHKSGRSALVPVASAVQLPRRWMGSEGGRKRERSRKVRGHTVWWEDMHGVFRIRNRFLPYPFEASER